MKLAIFQVAALSLLQANEVASLETYNLRASSAISQVQDIITSALDSYLEEEGNGKKKKKQNRNNDDNGNDDNGNDDNGSDDNVVRDDDLPATNRGNCKRACRNESTDWSVIRPCEAACNDRDEDGTGDQPTNRNGRVIEEECETRCDNTFGAGKSRSTCKRNCDSLKSIVGVVKITIDDMDGFMNMTQEELDAIEAFNPSVDVEEEGNNNNKKKKNKKNRNNDDGNDDDDGSSNDDNGKNARNKARNADDCSQGCQNQSTDWGRIRKCTSKCKDYKGSDSWDGNDNRNRDNNGRIKKDDCSDRCARTFRRDSEKSNKKKCQRNCDLGDFEAVTASV